MAILYQRIIMPILYHSKGITVYYNTVSHTEYHIKPLVYIYIIIIFIICISMYSSHCIYYGYK
jgi:hypothetical protein